MPKNNRHELKTSRLRIPLTLAQAGKNKKKNIAEK
jgi:hypothetical protein